MAVPVQNYESETGIWIAIDKNNLQTTEMRFIRQVAGYIILDYKLNIDIKRELEMFDFPGWVTSRTERIILEACKIPERETWDTYYCNEQTILRLE
jgi:hypothetical protein